MTLSSRSFTMKALLLFLTFVSIAHSLTPEQISEIQRFGRAARFLPVTSLETTNYPGPGGAGNENYGASISKYSFGPGGVPLIPNNSPIVGNLLGNALGGLENLANVAGVDGVGGFGGNFGSLGVVNNIGLGGLGNLGGGQAGFGGYGGFAGFGGPAGFGGMPDIPFVPSFGGFGSNIPITNGEGGSISSSIPLGTNGHAETNVGGGYGYGVSENGFNFGSSFGGTFSFDTSNSASNPPQAAFLNQNGEPVMSLEASAGGVTSKASGRMLTEKTEAAADKWDDWYRHK